MYEYAEIPVADLLFNVENPRLADAQGSQQEAALELAQLQGEKLVRLAADIVHRRLDPTTLPAVVATGDRRKRYKVVEGNRRLLALRALETPSLVAPALSHRANRRLAELAKRFEDDPIESILCVLFDSEDEADHWVRTRHTGENLGIGLIEWDAEEKDRYEARHVGSRRPAGQLIDFVEKHGNLSEAARTSRQGIITTVERMLETPDARQALGVDVENRRVVALYPLEELARSLTYFVEDLKLKRIRVPDLYHAEDRKRYVEGLPAGIRPKKSKKLDAPVPLDELVAGIASTKAPQPSRRPRRAKASRTTVIPKTTKIDIAPPRINRIYNELLDLNAERYPNACSVLLRVFIELSVDHYIADKKLMTDAQLRATVLAKKLKVVVKALEGTGRIPTKLARAIEAVADGQRHVLAASITNFHQYVHNEYVYPRAADLYTTWDEIAPFMEKVWP